MQKKLLFPFDGIAAAVWNTNCWDILELMPQLNVCSVCGVCYDRKIFRWQEQGHGCEINLHTAVLIVEKNVWHASTFYNLIIFRCCRKMLPSVKVLEMVVIWTLATLFSSGFRGAFLARYRRKTWWTNQAFGMCVLICENFLELWNRAAVRCCSLTCRIWWLHPRMVCGRAVGEMSWDLLSQAKPRL